MSTFYHLCVLVITFAIYWFILMIADSPNSVNKTMILTVAICVCGVFHYFDGQMRARND
jgi:D-alanyl-lipoteichoic acid acyltransferase DltB (MBOAT superfamily)